MKFEIRPKRFRATRQAAVLLFFAFCLVPCAQGQKPCGEERWPVKTLTDPDAALIKQFGDTTVAALTSLASPVAHSMAAVHEYEDSRLPEEERIVTVRVLVEGAMKEKDRDYHIVVSDPDLPSETMIAEIPDPTCGVAAKYKAQIAAARAYFAAHFITPTSKYAVPAEPVPAEITGVVFFDIIHGENGGQKGHAVNGVEIHPVLSIRNE